VLLRTSTRPRGKVARIATVAAAAAVCLTAATASNALAAAGPSPTMSASGATVSNVAGKPLTAGRYIVMFNAAPAAGYTGGVAGFHATQPVAGQHLRVTSNRVIAYRSHLTDVHRATLNRVNVPSRNVIYNYTVAFNGIAAQLSADQANALAKQPTVAKLFRDTVSKPDTNYSPTFLGLTRKHGLWNQLGGDSIKGAGKGEVIGVIDTGVWPENPGLRAAPLTKKVPGWHGTCEPGEGWSKYTCNSKLIGARYFYSDFGVDNISSADYLSARDYDGHGTHTSTTAGGRPVQAVVDGKSYGKVSGMAPGAYLAMYKACWTDVSDKNGCSGGDLVKAIDAAVSDGVDVINYSIGGGSESPVLAAEEVSFYYAARAGIFVSASAGNSGPGASTLDHPSPWETTVAASTFKILEQVAQTGDGHRYVGASATGTLRSTPAVLAGDIAASGVDPADAALCAPDSLDPALAHGKVVVCDRGVYDRVAKSAEVANEGGVGMVLVNVSPNSLNADLHSIPTVHLDDVNGAALENYVTNTPNPTIAIRPVKPGESTTRVPVVAAFSSRGPSIQTGGDVVKPDISAPGVDVLAGISPITDNGRNWDLESGTSMAAPHIAGIAALLRQAHPTWSPMMVKSAMMTTARNTIGTTSPFEQGAGNILPDPASNPGLVYDSNARNWVQFLEGLGYQTRGSGLHLGFGSAPAIDPSDLNAASIGIGALAGQQTVTRTVTNVSGKTETYRASVTGMAGIKVKVSPRRMTVPAHGKATFTVRFTTGTAALDNWATGNLTWTSSAHRVRSPMAVQPVALAAPYEVGGSIAGDGSGTTQVPITPGYSGTLDTQVFGLTAGAGQTGNVTIDPSAFDPTNPTPGPAVPAFPVTVAANTTAVQINARADVSSDDIDLYLYDSGGQLVAYSASRSGDETVTIPGLPAGSYTAYVHGYASATHASSADFTYTSWLVDDQDAGNLAVTPPSTSVTVAVPQNLGLSWTGLDPTKSYLGWVGYVDGGNLVGMTLVSVG
jgi:subtilisin family serine protease